MRTTSEAVGSSGCRHADGSRRANMGRMDEQSGDYRKERKGVTKVAMFKPSRSVAIQGEADSEYGDFG